MRTLVNLYGVLGVDPKADAPALRRAYRRLVRKHHPDVNSDPRSHDVMARINEAFNTLINPSARREYDLLLRHGMLDDAFAQPTKRKPVLVKLGHRAQLHRTPIYGLTFDSSSGLFISSSFDNEFVWFDPSASSVRKRIRLEGAPVVALRAAPGGEVVAAGTAESQLSLWRIAPEGRASLRAIPTPWLSCVDVSPGGESIAAGSVSHGLSVYRSADASLMYTRQDHAASITAVAFSPDGRLVASGSADATVRLRRASSGALLHVFDGLRSTVSAIAFSPDGRSFAAASVDYSVRVFSLADGSLQKVMFGHSKPIEALAFHPNGWLLASAARDGQVHLWNSRKGLGQLEVSASSLPVSNLAFSRDGEWLAAGGLDKVVRLWSVTARQED